jgi:nucleotide-binding universal stress UspA family protein
MIATDVEAEMMAENEMALRIVVGADGSPSARAALRWAVRQAERTGASIAFIMHAAPFVVVRGPDRGIPAQQHGDTALADPLSR